MTTPDPEKVTPEQAAAFVAEHMDRITKGMLALVATPDGKVGTPFVLLLPVQDGGTVGSHVITNMPGDDALMVLHKTLQAHVREKLLQAIAAGAVTAIALSDLFNDSDDDNTKVH